VAVEIGDWHRLTGRSIGAYLGLVPTESSSGASRSQGGITKTGTLIHPDRRRATARSHAPDRRDCCQHCRTPDSTSTSASTTSATPTPPGSSPAAPTSSPWWNAWVTPRSWPPRSTCTHFPTPTTSGWWLAFWS